MPTSETAEAVTRSVTDLARPFRLSGQEFNVGLWLAGLLGGEPGAWWFTEKGARFATEHYHQNGYGGYAHRSWHTTTWLETVTDELDLSEAGIARIRQVLADRKRIQKAARETATAAADAAFLASHAAKHRADAAPDVGGANRTRVIVGLGAAVTVYGLYKAVPLVRRRWQLRSDAPEQVQDGEAPSDA